MQLYYIYCSFQFVMYETKNALFCETFRKIYCSTANFLIVRQIILLDTLARSSYYNYYGISSWAGLCNSELLKRS